MHVKKVVDVMDSYLKTLFPSAVLTTKGASYQYVPWKLPY